MSYDSSRYRGDAAYSDDADDGFRQSLSYRTPGDVAYQPPEPDVSTYGTNGSPSPVAEIAPADEPRRRPRPKRDRLGVHFGWEFVLLLAAGAVAALLYRTEPAALRGTALDGLYLYVTVLGFVTVGASLSLRAAVPNLSLGPVAYAAGLFFADNSERGLVVTAGVTGLAAIAVGLAMAVVVTTFHVPAWATSLAAGFAVIVWIQQQRGVVEVVNGAYRPTEHPEVWFGIFVAVSVIGGAAGLFTRVRRATGRFRPSGDPERRGAGGVSAAFALAASSLLAAAAGVVLALYNRELNPTENGLALTGLGLGAALLGGASVFGRRGGLFGSALAVILIALVATYVEARGRVLPNLALAAATIGVGLVVSRLVEALGRRRADQAGSEPEVPVQREPEPAAAPAADDWSGWAAEPAPRPADEWEDRWASR